MKEAQVQAEIRKMLRYRYRLWPDHVPDIAAIKVESGRPDLLIMNPFGASMYIEIKAFDLSRYKSFSLNWINPKQREWLSAWEELRLYGSYIAIGTVNIRPRGIWIIPWADWLGIEGMFSLYQDSIPYEVGPGFNKALQRSGLDFRVLEQYKLVLIPAKSRVAGVKWQFNKKQEELWMERISYSVPASF